VTSLSEEIDALAGLCGLDVKNIVKNTYAIVATVEDYDFLIKLGVFKAKLKKNGYIVLPKSQVSDIGCVIEILKE
jgi:hypothetical protein